MKRLFKLKRQSKRVRKPRRLSMEERQERAAVFKKVPKKSKKKVKVLPVVSYPGGSNCDEILFWFVFLSLKTCLNDPGSNNGWSRW